MSSSFTTISVFDEHPRAEAAIAQLGKAGFEINRAKNVLDGINPTRVDIYSTEEMREPALAE